MADSKPVLEDVTTVEDATGVPADARRLRRSRVLACEGDDVFFSRGYRLHRSTDGLRSHTPVATLSASLVERFAARSRLLWRLGRLGLHTLARTPRGTWLAVARKRIARLEEKSGRFQVTRRISRGSRPLGLAVSPDGFVVYGEYWANPDRLPLRVFASTDDGRSWRVVHTLAAGAAKHIHNVLWDEHRQGFWIFTGDRGRECAIYFTPDRFRTLREVARGQQQYRVCAGFCTPNGLVYGTDSEIERNWIVRLDPDTGETEKIQPLEGSSLYASRMGGRFYLSTCVETSEVNRHDRAALWESTNLSTWRKVCEWQKDRWGKTLFQFGNILLPTRTHKARYVAFSGVAVRHDDLTTVCFDGRGGQS